MNELELKVKELQMQVNFLEKRLDMLEKRSEAENKDDGQNMQMIMNLLQSFMKQQETK